MVSKVLLVEDNGDARGMIKIFLEINGCDVIEAADGYQAVERALESSPDLVLMDIAMPVLDGVQATTAMRQHESLRDTPIVWITAFNDFYDDQAKIAGCTEVVAKPTDPDELKPLLQRYLKL